MYSSLWSTLIGFLCSVAIHSQKAHVIDSKYGKLRLSNLLVPLYMFVFHCCVNIHWHPTWATYINGQPTHRFPFFFFIQGRDSHLFLSKLLLPFLYMLAEKRVSICKYKAICKPAPSYQQIVWISGFRTSSNMVLLCMMHVKCHPH